MSVFPIIRMPAQMHYCEYINPALVDVIDNAVWKTIYKTAPDVFFYDRPGSRVIDYILNGGKHLD